MTTPINTHQLLRLVCSLMDEEIKHINFRCESIDNKNNIIKYDMTCPIVKAYNLVCSIGVKELENIIQPKEWLVKYIGESIPAPPYTEYPDYTDDPPAYSD